MYLARWHLHVPGRWHVPEPRELGGGKYLATCHVHGRCHVPGRWYVPVPGKMVGGKYLARLEDVE